MPTCPVTGRTFEVSSAEMALRKKLGIEGEPDVSPIVRWQILGAFWQHWALHKRTCDKTGKQIISVFSQDCPYPVWHKDEWIKHADPPSAEIDLRKPLFPQMWELFRRCPIPHNLGAGNENCEYTDDWWYSRNCYLSHSGVKDENLRYCFRMLRVKDSQFSVFSCDSQRTLDCIFSFFCFRALFTLHCRQCSDSAFLYDCRNCNRCILCSNLRNKQYCIRNQQYTEEEYLRRAREFDFRSRNTYEKARREFLDMLRTRAWHRALLIDLSEDATGNYLDGCRRSINCFFATQDVEDCIHCIRGGVHSKDCLDCVNFYEDELVYMSSSALDKCYSVRFGYGLIQCKFLEYCAHCFQCQHCFGCCGLVKKKYHIFNTPHEPEEYEKKKAAIIAMMKYSGEYGKFFPAHFAANPYEESLAGFHWPLSKEQGRGKGFRMREEREERTVDTLEASLVPDRSDASTDDLSKKVFWDSVARRPFQIAEADIAFAKDLGSPLPSTYYMRRLQENFRLIPFDGTLREVACGKCRKGTQTSWPTEYDGRILCEECYLKEVY